jgi:hypothetical protein
MEFTSTLTSSMSAWDWEGSRLKKSSNNCNTVGALRTYGEVSVSKLKLLK